MSKPKLKDGKANKIYELYPLGAVPNSIICKVAKWIVYNFAVGKSDINGEDWGDIFAKAIALRDKESGARSSRQGRRG